VNTKRLVLALSVCLLASIACKGHAPSTRALTAEVPLHLEDHLDAARITGSEVPKDLPEPLEWRFDKDAQGWKVTAPFKQGINSFKQGIKPAQMIHQDGALRLTLAKENSNRWGYRMGVLYVDLPDLSLDDWGFIVVEVKSRDDTSYLMPCLNLSEKRTKGQGKQNAFESWGDMMELASDGEVHPYFAPMESVSPSGLKGPLRQLGIAVGASGKDKDGQLKGPIAVDIVSVKVIPKEAAYAGSNAGVLTESWGETGRRALYTHVPGKIEYDMVIPDKGRLDFGLGVLKKKSPVKFKISARETGAEAAPRVLMEETFSGEAPNPQRSVDLLSLSGKTVTLALETEAEGPGNVAFWAAPTLHGVRATSLPNIVFYVIDGASADLMSVYGYNRRTTPCLERLAAEGAVFEHAFSNSSWTQVSVTSFMTSLHNSVLGGDEVESNPLPEKAVTMAERMHKAGYLTEILTSNPYCGRMSGLDRCVDIVSDSDPEAGGLKATEMSSAVLHRAYWEIREAYPIEPYWIHFQTTDVHWPWKHAGSFAGLFSTLEERKTLDGIFEKMEEIQWTNFDDRIAKSGVDKALFWQLCRKAYDECMAHQDAAIGRLVERIKDRGEWANTLFIVAADHGHESAQLTLFDPKKPAKYFEPNLASQISRIPMIFVWPGKILPGRRFSEPVSMIDMLPTVLDLAGLPPLETTQGQSLAPLLLGKPGWTPRPVVFDEFYVDDEYFYGSVDVIDGRWGASLEIDPRPKEKKSPQEFDRPAPLLVFDLWEDPHAFKSLHADRPDLVEKYTKMIDGIWKEHQRLAKAFTRSSSLPLTSAQIETLRSLGYLR